MSRAINNPTEAELNEALYGEKKRTSKYGVAPKADRTADNITFDSKREMERASK